VRSATATFCAAVLLGAAAPALAQVQLSPYSTSVYREGPGIRFADAPLVLHPGVAIEGGYDSNVFFMPSNPIGAGMLRLRAHIDLATLPPQRMEGDAGTADPKVDFRFTTQVEYREYFSGETFVQQQRNVNVVVGADLGILPRGPFTLRISDIYTRTVDPRNLEQVPTGTPSTLNRNYNRAGLAMTHRPGAGRLEWGLADFFELTLWENSDLKTLGDLIYNDVQAHFSMKFLAETVLRFSARAGYLRYLNQPSLEAAPFRLTAGVSSPVTRWLGIGAAIGYGGSFHLFTGQQSIHTVIANAEVRFTIPSRATRFTLGYTRDFFDTIFAAWFVDDRLFVAFDQPLAYRLIAHLDGGVRFRSYGGLQDPAVLGAAGYCSSERNDLLYDAHAELRVRATNWLELAASYNLIGNHTDFCLLEAGTMRPIPLGYIKHAAFARIDFAY
jgi:hypothetical protein